MTARCQWCERPLRTPASIATGYGPVCARNLNLHPTKPAIPRQPASAPATPHDEPTGQLTLEPED